MNIQVRYYTRSGNTRKLAEAVGKALNVRPASVDEGPMTERADILFLGCSYYAFDVDDAVKSFVDANRAKIGRIVLFGTSAMMKSIYRPMKKVCDGAGVELTREEFHCRGSFGIAHKGRPNGDDCAAAASFAKNVSDKYGADR